MKRVLITIFTIGNLFFLNLGFSQNTLTQTPTQTPLNQPPGQQGGNSLNPNSPADTALKPELNSTNRVPSTPSQTPAVPSVSQNGAQAKWQTFSYQEKGFSVALPSDPEHTHQDLALPNSQLKIPYDIYVSDPSDKVSYLVGVAVYPSEVNVSIPENNLKAAVNGTLGSTPGGKLISSENTTFINYPAVDFYIEGVNYHMKGKYVLVGHTLYQLMVAYDKSADVSTDFKTFIGSFRLTR